MNLPGKWDDEGRRQHGLYRLAAAGKVGGCQLYRRGVRTAGVSRQGNLVIWPPICIMRKSNPR